MLTEYGYIALFLILIILIAIAMVMSPVLLRLLGLVPRKPNPVKNSIFECGMTSIGKTWVRFHFRSYFYGLVFLILDVFIVFLYPWAANLRTLGGAAFVTMIIFNIVMVIVYIYAWRKKTLEWK